MNLNQESHKTPCPSGRCGSRSAGPVGRDCAGWRGPGPWRGPGDGATGRGGPAHPVQRRGRLPTDATCFCCVAEPPTCLAPAAAPPLRLAPALGLPQEADFLLGWQGQPGAARPGPGSIAPRQLGGSPPDLRALARSQRPGRLRHAALHLAARRRCAATCGRSVLSAALAAPVRRTHADTGVLPLE